MRSRPLVPETPVNPKLQRLNDVIEGTLVDVSAFRAVFRRIERSYGEAARALDRALERLGELTEVRDALIAGSNAEADDAGERSGDPPRDDALIPDDGPPQG